MIIYNVTSKVTRSVAVDWLRWLKEEHIPDLVNTGCFTHAVICHLTEADDEDGITYAVQYHAGDEADYKKYREEFAEKMQKNAIDKWGNQVISFRTIMKVVN
jgi:hypothetical protein